MTPEKEKHFFMVRFLKTFSYSFGSLNTIEIRSKVTSFDALELKS